MRLSTARNILGGIWLGTSLLYMFMLFLKAPELGDESGEVLKKGSTFIAPCLALIITFFFGVHQDVRDKHVANPVSFVAAIVISGFTLTAMFYSTFVWSNGILKNLQMGEIFVAWFSALTIVAMNYFFVGAATKETPEPNASAPKPTVPNPTGPQTPAGGV